jgi:hypothetical protein
MNDVGCNPAELPAEPEDNIRRKGERAKDAEKWMALAVGSERSAVTEAGKPRRDWDHEDIATHRARRIQERACCEGSNSHLDRVRCLTKGSDEIEKAAFGPSEPSDRIEEQNSHATTSP